MRSMNLAFYSFIRFTFGITKACREKFVFLCKQAATSELDSTFENASCCRRSEIEVEERDFWRVHSFVPKSARKENETEKLTLHKLQENNFVYKLNTQQRKSTVRRKLQHCFVVTRLENSPNDGLELLRRTKPRKHSRRPLRLCFNPRGACTLRDVSYTNVVKNCYISWRR